MSDLTVANRRLTASVVKLPQGLDAAAAQAIAKNGADDVVIRIGADTFVASGRGLALGGVKAGTAATIDGRAGQVVQVDKQLNSLGEGLRAWPGLAVGGVGAAWGLVGFAQGVITGANMAGLGLILAAGAVVLGVAINVVPALYGHFRKVDA